MNAERANYSTLTNKPVLVIGANGYMGSHTCKQLVNAGRSEIRAMTRENSRTEALDTLPVTRVVGDVSDIESLRNAMRGCGSVFYSVVNTQAWLTDPTPLYECNVEGLRNALDAAREENIDCFIFTSSMVTIGTNPNGRASEADAFNWWDTAPHYAKTRVLAENLMMEYCEKYAFPGIALCVANTYGPEDFQPTPHGQLIWNAATGRLPTALDCSAPTVDIRDAAEVALLAEQYGRFGERYIVANEFLSQPELYAIAAAELGRPAPKTMSMGVAYFIAGTNEIWSKIRGKKDVQLCRSSILLSEAFGDLDNKKAREELGWKPRPIKETLQDAIAWYSEHFQKQKVKKPE